MKSHVSCALRVESHISSGLKGYPALREQTLKILRIVTLPTWSCFRVERGMPPWRGHACTWCSKSICDGYNIYSYACLEPCTLFHFACNCLALQPSWDRGASLLRNLVPYFLALLTIENFFLNFGNFLAKCNRKWAVVCVPKCMEK